MRQRIANWLTVLITALTLLAAVIVALLQSG
jgi:hypothetical protein